MTLSRIFRYLFPQRKGDQEMVQAVRRVNAFLQKKGLDMLTDDSRRKIKIVHYSSSGYDHGRRTLFLNPGDAVDSILAVSDPGYLYLHETGHFFLEAILPREHYDRLKGLFGDFDMPYKRNFETDANEDDYVSYYATVHPMDDFAETFAVVLSQTPVKGKSTKCKEKISALERMLN